MERRRRQKLLENRLARLSPASTGMIQDSEQLSGKRSVKSDKARPTPVGEEIAQRAAEEAMEKAEEEAEESPSEAPKAQ